MTTELTGPTWGGAPVTHEQYALLSAQASHLSLPPESYLAHARHLDTGCPTCLGDVEHFDRMHAENAELEGLRRKLAGGILKARQSLDAWAEQDKLHAAGRPTLPPPTAEERLAVLDRIIRALDRVGS